MTTSAAAAFLTGSQVSQTVGGGKQFLKFDAKRTGEWVFGREAEPVTDDVFSLDVPSLKHGWILWHAKKADRKMTPVNTPLPTPQASIEYTDAKGKIQVDEPNEARSFEGTFEDGTQFVLEVSTFGGRKAFDGMFAEMIARATAGSPYMFPQVKLATSSYEHGQYGKVYAPELVCVAWFDGAGDPDPETEMLEAPAKAAEAPAKAAEAPAPTRRRSRSPQ